MELVLSAICILVRELRAKSEAVKTNKEECMYLYERVERLANGIPKPCPDGKILAVEYLRSILNCATALVTSFMDSKWYMKMWNANKYSEEFAELHRKINECSLDFSLVNSLDTTRREAAISKDASDNKRFFEMFETMNSKQDGIAEELIEIKKLLSHPHVARKGNKPVWFIDTGKKEGDMVVAKDEKNRKIVIGKGIKKILIYIYIYIPVPNITLVSSTAIYIYVCVCMCVCMYMYIHIYTYLHIHILGCNGIYLLLFFVPQVTLVSYTKGLGVAPGWP